MSDSFTALVGMRIVNVNPIYQEGYLVALELKLSDGRLRIESRRDTRAWHPTAPTINFLSTVIDTPTFTQKVLFYD